MKIDHVLFLSGPKTFTFSDIFKTVHTICLCICHDRLRLKANTKSSCENRSLATGGLM